MRIDLRRYARDVMCTREEMTIAYAMRRLGHTYLAIGRDLGINHDRVRVWVSNPGLYDPISDPIAVERAFNGDIRALNNLTVWEFQEFLEKLKVFMVYNREEENAQRAGQKIGEYLPSPGMIRFGIEAWAQILATMRGRKAAARARAA